MLVVTKVIKFDNTNYNFIILFFILEQEKVTRKNRTVDIERDIQIWFQKVEIFFNTHFFSANTKYRTLEKLSNLK
jgi:hypothetical protein